MNIYQQNGYTDRLDYLKNLAENNGVPLNVVISVAELLGENEDFDGLVSACEDYQELEIGYES